LPLNRLLIKVLTVPFGAAEELDKRKYKITAIAMIPKITTPGIIFFLDFGAPGEIAPGGAP
jgi:hypothetical protein